MKNKQIENLFERGTKLINKNSIYYNEASVLEDSQIDKLLAHGFNINSDGEITIPPHTNMTYYGVTLGMHLISINGYKIYVDDSSIYKDLFIVDNK